MTPPAGKVAASLRTESKELPPPRSRKETVLLAVTGISAAVVTETLWALALERPPVVPDRICLLITTAGERSAEEELLSPSPALGGRTVWEALRESLLGDRAPSDCRLMLEPIRILGSPAPSEGRRRPLDDIRTAAANEHIADALLEEVRQFTENPDTVLIASIAGGRKTMSVLLYACLSLLGRPQDRVTHVLVNPPFDDPCLSPRFYFPTRPALRHHCPGRGSRKARTVSSDAARIALADIPFVPLRLLFPRQIGSFPGRFTSLVRSCSEEVRSLAQKPSVSLGEEAPILLVNGISVPLSGREHALYSFLLERHRQQKPPFPAQKNALEDLDAFLRRWAERWPPESFQHRAAEEWREPTEEDLRKLLSSIKGKLMAAGLVAELSHLLPRRGAFGIDVCSPNKQRPPGAR